VPARCHSVHLQQDNDGFFLFVREYGLLAGVRYLLYNNIPNVWYIFVQKVSHGSEKSVFRNLVGIVRDNVVFIALSFMV
jgi:hypothetical protein